MEKEPGTVLLPDGLVRGLLESNAKDFGYFEMENQIGFEYEADGILSIAMHVRPVVGIPNFEPIFEKVSGKPSVQVRASRNEFLDVVSKALAVTARHSEREMELKFDSGGILVTARGEYLNFREHVEAEVKGKGRVKCGPAYVYDFLRMAAGEEITCRLYGESLPFVLVDDSGDQTHQCLLAPRFASSSDL